MVYALVVEVKTVQSVIIARSKLNLEQLVEGSKCCIQGKSRMMDSTTDDPVGKVNH